MIKRNYLQLSFIVDKKGMVRNCFIGFAVSGENSGDSLRAYKAAVKELLQQEP